VPAPSASAAPPAVDARLPTLPADAERRLREVVAGVLGVDPAALDDGFGPADSPLWTSLNHLRLMSSLERALGVRFTMAEVRSLASLGEIRRAVATRL
jgi:acyl carrier protein